MGDEKSVSYFLNYISHCVCLLYKAIKQTVFVVCTVKWQKYCIIRCICCTNYNRGMGRELVFPSHSLPLYLKPALFNYLSVTRLAQSREC